MKKYLAITVLILTISLTLLCQNGDSVKAQLGERPGNSLTNPIDQPRDLSGLSLKNPRVRIVHTIDPHQLGGSMYLQQNDPWLGYQWGRSLTQREFRERDGIYGDAGKLDGILLPDGTTKIMSRSHANSCAICHNTPYRDGGAGATIAKNGGAGRNTPHMFGAGLIEMIGMQIRLQALAIADTNRDGWISHTEANGKRCLITNLPKNIAGNQQLIDLGRFEDLNNDGRPDLNELFNPIYVDKDGKRIAYADSLTFPEVAGYTFEAQSFGFGHLYMPFRPPVPTSLRAFIANPFDIHSGLQAFDPTTLNDPDGDGFAQVSNAGALQCVTAVGKDRGAMRGPTGISRDDPDRDGYCEEISEGDLDMAEWYLLNHPAPARGKITTMVRRGEKLFAQLGCISCHIPDWQIKAANPSARDYTERYDGDRRFFELPVKYNIRNERLEGKLIYLADHKNGLLLPRRQAYTVQGIYSDFKYHDLGADFYQLQFDGSVVRKWRTTPLWGVGTTAPYGHDGASLSLDEVIRRHGGEALAARQAYHDLSASNRQAVIAFLESLVLYQTDRLPCDLDGDGKIKEHFKVAGIDTGYERFNPEWLFQTPAQIEGWIENVRGEKILSYALTNVWEAYGLNLEYLKDADEDGFPDVLDPAPRKRGYRDGIN
ncbi:MAG: di-heme oxidoredictase family protein [Acidobacteriota bacterium]